MIKKGIKKSLIIPVDFHKHLVDDCNEKYEGKFNFIEESNEQDYSINVDLLKKEDPNKLNKLESIVSVAAAYVDKLYSHTYINSIKDELASYSKQLNIISDSIIKVIPDSVYDHEVSAKNVQASISDLVKQYY